jgi:uncharacterized protein YuzE
MESGVTEHVWSVENLLDCWGNAYVRPCQKIAVDQEVCYIRFVEEKPHHSGALPYQTARGEMLIADFDADGKIIGIELVGPTGQKPCQS